jgi:hypothetical protein
MGAETSSTGNLPLEQMYPQRREQYAQFVLKPALAQCSQDDVWCPEMIKTLASLPLPAEMVQQSRTDMNSDQLDIQISNQTKQLGCDNLELSYWMNREGNPYDACRLLARRQVFFVARDIQSHEFAQKNKHQLPKPTAADIVSGRSCV